MKKRPNYTREQVDTIIKKTIAKMLEVDLSEIKDESNVVGDLNADGLDSLEIVITLEDKFLVPLQEKDLGSSGYSFTVKGITDVICDKLGIK